jgi:DNA-directed RNA polymerase specialized sigma24 family protein
MTPEAEARFIALWQTGATQAQIAAALGIPQGTVTSRSTRSGPGGPAATGR